MVQQGEKDEKLNFQGQWLTILMLYSMRQSPLPQSFDAYIAKYFTDSLNGD